MLFYNEPKKFFENHKTLLNNTSYYDELGNSIFAHYFNVLYNIFINKDYSYSEIYISNFNSFFKFHKNYITIQDLSLETPLHKIAKFENKIFFITYCNKLRDIDIINEQILLIQNLNKKTCFDFILEELEINRTKFINNNYDLYNYFFKMNNTIVEKLPMEIQMNIKLFSLSINFDEKLYKDIKFNELYTSLKNLFYNVKNNIIDYPFFNPNINILNCLFNYAVLSNDNSNFAKIFIFISDLLEENLDKNELLQENKIDENKNKKISLQWYVYNHIGYVLRKMNLENKSKKNEINEKYNQTYNSENYALRLIDKILPFLLYNYSFEEFKDKEIKGKCGKCKFNINSLVINLAKNPYLNFEKKYEIFNSLENKLKNHFDEDTDEDVLYLYLD